MQLQLLANVTAANGQPTLVTDGRPLRKGVDDPRLIDYVHDGLIGNVDEVTLLLKGIGTGALTISYLRLWLMFRVWDSGTNTFVWVPVGTGVDADKGKLNSTTVTIGEVQSDVLLHAERIRGLCEAERAHLEVGVVGGAVTAIDAWLLSRGQAPGRG